MSGRQGDESQALAPATRPAARWSLVVAAVLLLCALPAAVAGARVDRWAARALEEMARPGGVFALVSGLLALDTVLPVPSSVVAVVAGHRLGFVGATAAIAAGLCAGNVVGYLLGRLAGAGVVERVVGTDQLERARALAGSRPGAVALAVTRPVPVVSEATIVLAGAARAPVARTAAVCLLANLGLAAAYAAMGSAAHGPAAVPLALGGSVGVPVAAAVLAAVVGRRRPSPNKRSPAGPPIEPPPIGDSHSEEVPVR